MPVFNVGHETITEDNPHRPVLISEYSPMWIAVLYIRSLFKYGLISTVDVVSNDSSVCRSEDKAANDFYMDSTVIV